MSVSDTPLKISHHAVQRVLQRTDRSDVYRSEIRSWWDRGVPVDMVGVETTEARFVDTQAARRSLVILRREATITTVIYAESDGIQFLHERPDLICSCGATRLAAADTARCDACGATEWGLLTD